MPILRKQRPDLAFERSSLLACMPTSKVLLPAHASEKKSEQPIMLIRRNVCSHLHVRPCAEEHQCRGRVKAGASLHDRGYHRVGWRDWVRAFVAFTEHLQRPLSFEDGSHTPVDLARGRQPMAQCIQQYHECRHV